MTSRLVIIESRYAGATQIEIDLHVAYARRALRHSLDLGEAPIASHLLYTQVLDDAIPAQRAQGIAAGLAWRRAYSAINSMRPCPCGCGPIRHTEQRTVLPAFYVDLGWSSGMEEARRIYRQEGIAYEVRHIFPGTSPSVTRWEP